MSNKSIWDIFKKANSTPDLTANLKDMEDSKSGLKDRLATMLDLNEEILTTSGPDGHAEHLRGMREIEDKIVTFDTAIGILKKRIEEAARKENDAKTDAIVSQGRETNKLLRNDYLEIHNLASALGDRLRQAKERSVAIQNANAFIIAAKRPELKIIPVLSALARHLGVTTDMIGTAGSNFVHDPVKEFVLPEYYPQEATKFGKRLAALKDVEV